VHSVVELSPNLLLWADQGLSRPQNCHQGLGRVIKLLLERANTLLGRDQFEPVR